MRYVVVLSRTDIDVSEGFSFSFDTQILGPFRTKLRAEKRAATIRKLADQYEDPEGVTGPDNALDVVVEPLLSGDTSAQHAVDGLYGTLHVE